jgi:hypothetical protein
MAANSLPFAAISIFRLFGCEDLPEIPEAEGDYRRFRLAADSPSELLFRRRNHLSAR